MLATVKFPAIVVAPKLAVDVKVNVAPLKNFITSLIANAFVNELTPIVCGPSVPLAVIVLATTPPALLASFIVT